MTKIAINGFGRIGRLLFKRIYKEFDVVAINDLGDPENLAYLLRYDTVYGVLYGKYKAKVIEENGEKYFFMNEEKKIRILQEKDPKNLPWKNLGIDIVIEATGVFDSFEKANMHCEAGAKRVVITAPAKDEDGSLGKTVLVGINDEDFEGVRITSNGSCTTNAVTPVIQILSETLGIEKAMLNTVHAYTATQSVVDSPVKGKDWRRGRAGAQNIIPSTTGAAIVVGRVIAEVRGKFDGIAMRVPVPTGSIADITMVTKKNTTPEEVNEILKNAEKEKRWEGIIRTSEDGIVSSDILGESYGAIIDLPFTKVVGGNLVKVLSWYDNEAGYVSMLLRHIRGAAKFL